MQLMRTECSMEAENLPVVSELAALWSDLRKRPTEESLGDDLESDASDIQIGTIPQKVPALARRQRRRGETLE